MASKRKYREPTHRIARGPKTGQKVTLVNFPYKMDGTINYDFPAMARVKRIDRRANADFHIPADCLEALVPPKT